MRLRHSFLLTAAFVAASAAVTTTAHAQAQTAGTRFGVEADYGNNSVSFGLGAFVKFHLAEMNAHPITGRVSFDYYFPSYDVCDGCSLKYFEVNADGLYDISAQGNVKPYVGAGLTLAHSSFSYNTVYCDEFADICGSASSSDFGLNLLGGINFMSNSKLMPFVEVKYELRSGGELILKGGIHF